MKFWTRPFQNWGEISSDSERTDEASPTVTLVNFVQKEDYSIGRSNAFSFLLKMSQPWKSES